MGSYSELKFNLKLQGTRAMRSLRIGPNSRLRVDLMLNGKENGQAHITCLSLLSLKIRPTRAVRRKRVAIMDTRNIITTIMLR